MLVKHWGEATAIVFLCGRELASQQGSVEAAIGANMSDTLGKNMSGTLGNNISDPLGNNITSVVLQLSCFCLV